MVFGLCPAGTEFYGTPQGLYFKEIWVPKLGTTFETIPDCNHRVGQNKLRQIGYTLGEGFLSHTKQMNPPFSR